MTNTTLSQAIELGRLDAIAQSRLVQEGELTSQELIEAALMRIEHANVKLNAVCHLVQAPEQPTKTFPRSPFFAAPVLLKDSLDCVGMPSCAGSRVNSPAPRETEYPLVQAMRRAGLALIGKSSMPELGLLPSTEPVLYGPARNPWRLSHSPGGSSGGAGVAVAAGLVPLAHASDGAGSIRIPASCCGVFGFKPSRGANLMARAPHPIEDLTCADSLIARSVRDAAYAHAVLNGSNALPPPMPARALKVGVITKNLLGETPDPQVRHALEQAATLCETLGHVVEPLETPFEGGRIVACIQDMWGLFGAEILANVRASKLNEDLLEPWTKGLGEWGASRASTRAYLLSEINAITASVHAQWPNVDVLLSPVLKNSTCKLGDMAPDVEFGGLFARMFDAVSYSPIANVAGLASMSAPLHWSASGLPIGAMFTARQGSDAMLFGLARQLEEATGWTNRWPPTHD